VDVRREVDFFDRFEEEHGDYDVLGEAAYRRLLGLFREAVGPWPGAKVIDLGCGTGAFTRRLAAAFALDLTGMDISPRCVRRAAELAGGPAYVVGDITQTGLAGASFDAVVYSGVLHHCDERAVRVQVLREGLRLLRPGGRLFSYDPSWHSPSMWLYRDPASPLFSPVGKTANEVLLKRHELETELREAGFADVRIRGAGGITYRWLESRTARLILPLYNLYELLLRHSPVEDRWGTFLIGLARKASVSPARAA
jgi:SAM-dependent methyltransferase